MLSGWIAFWTQRVSKGKELKKTLKEECDGVLERENLGGGGEKVWLGGMRWRPKGSLKVWGVILSF